jgi:hypothetical protein
MLSHFGYNFECRNACAKLARCNEEQKKIVTNRKACWSPPGEAKTLRENKMKQTMKRNILMFAAAGAIALGGFVVAQAQAGGGFACAHGHGFGLRHLTDELNLTADQQTKVQPILDAAKPQIAAIHQEAMQKMKGVMDSTTSQIRPLLTADQQKKFDAIQKAHQDMMNAHKELQDATQD